MEARVAGGKKTGQEKESLQLVSVTLVLDTSSSLSGKTMTEINTRSQSQKAYMDWPKPSCPVWGGRDGDMHQDPGEQHLTPMCHCSHPAELEGPKAGVGVTSGLMTTCRARRVNP